MDMGRPARIQYPGALYHVTSRGNERLEIFREDADRRTFLEILRRYLKGGVIDGVTARRALLEPLVPERLVREVGLVFGVSETAILKRGYGNQARNAAVYLVKKHTGLDNRQVGVLFGGIHPSTVSKTYSRFGADLIGDKHLRRLVEQALSNANGLLPKQNLRKRLECMGKSPFALPSN